MELDIANEIALIVCKSCGRNDSESEVDYSTRLYETFCKCHNNVQSHIDDENSVQALKGLEGSSKISF